MKKLFYRIGADFVFLFHFALVGVALFGWVLTGIWEIYVLVLTVTLISDLLYGHCIVSEWEFKLRKRIEPDLNYDYSWLSYYIYRFTKFDLEDRIFAPLVYSFLTLSLVINVVPRVFL